MTTVYQNSNGLHKGTDAGSKAVLYLSKLIINTTNETKTLPVVYNISRESVHEDKAFRNQSRRVKCML